MLKSPRNVERQSEFVSKTACECKNSVENYVETVGSQDRNALSFPQEKIAQPEL